MNISAPLPFVFLVSPNIKIMISSRKYDKTTSPLHQERRISHAPSYVICIYTYHTLIISIRLNIISPLELLRVLGFSHGIYNIIYYITHTQKN